MTAAVRNWMSDFKGTAIYPDLFDESRLHYGPKPSWSNLSMRSLGDRVTLVQGEIDLGYSKDELAKLITEFKGNMLSPLVAANMIDSIELSVEAGPEHTLQLTTIPSIPFPKVQFNGSIMHSDNRYKQLLDELKRRWDEKTIVSGKLTLEYDMMEVKFAYLVSLDYRQATVSLTRELGKGPVSKTSAYAAATKYIQGGFSDFATSLFPDGSRPFEESVQAYLIDRLTSEAFMPNETIINFDSGEKHVGQRLREPESLGEPVSSRYVQSFTSIETINIL